MFKEAATSSVKMDENGGDDASPYILRAMKNCKILEMLMALTSSVQVLMANVLNTNISRYHFSPGIFSKCIWSSVQKSGDYWCSMIH